MEEINLSKVKLELLDGTVQEMDVSKELAQIIFKETQQIEEHDFSMNLYKDPIVILTDDNREIIKKYVSEYFKAFVKIAIFKMLEEDNLEK